MSDAFGVLLGDDIAGLIVGYLYDPIGDDFKDFMRNLELDDALDAEKVVDDADSLVRESLSEQTIVDEVLAQQWSQRDISPADWGTISLFYRESVHATWLRDKHARDEAASAAYLVAHGDG